jgi:hypothetical protein
MKSSPAAIKVLSMVLGLFALLVASIANAQLPTATILGVVKDSTGAIVPGAELSARNTDTGQTRTATSAANGAFRFSALPVGAYEVRAEHSGFQTAIRSGIILAVQDEAVVNFTLELGAIEQTVTVSEQAPLVNTTSGSLGGLVDEQKVSDLPLNGRNYIDLTLMQTGVEEHKNASKTGGLTGTIFSSNGAPIRSNNFLLDGAIMQNFAGVNAASVSGSSLGVEGIREYRVITNSFSAEYGMTMGSQMVIVSKGGSNAFHGSVFEYLRNSVLDARNFFDYQTPTSPGRLPPFKRNQFGGSFGGPIRKDRTFFFGVLEALRERLGKTLVTNDIGMGCHGTAGATITSAQCPQLGGAGVSATITPVIAPLLALYPLPNLSGNRLTFPFSQPTNENYGQMRVDQNFATNDSLFVRYTIDDTTQTQPIDYPQFLNARVSRFQYTTLSENHIFSPSLLNTARLSYSRTRVAFDSPSGLSGPQYSFVPGQELGPIMIGGVTAFGPNNTTPNAKIQNLYTASDDLFYTKGRHSFKFGTLINYIQQFTQNGTGVKGSITFANLLTFLQGQASTYTAVTPGSQVNRLFTFTTLGFYAQDDFRATPRLTLNLGLRYEISTQIRETRGRGVAIRDIQHDANTTLGIPLVNPSLKNVSPRFGFAWDVAGDGKTALRGGFAELYDLANIATALSAEAQATPPFSENSSVTTPTALALPLTFPASTAGRALRIVDYHLQQAHILQYNLTMERQLPFQMGLTVAYGGSRGINLMQIKEGNPTVPQGVGLNGTCVRASADQIANINRSNYCWLAGDPRTNPFWSTIEEKTAAGDSWYNSLQIGLLKRLSKGLQLQSSYTYSKAIDDTQGQQNVDSTASSDIGMDPTHSAVDRAVSDFNTTHNWRFNAIYNLPGVTNGQWIGKLLSGWRASGILSLQSGLPFTPVVQADRDRAAVNNAAAGINRPNLVAGRNNSNIVLGGPDQYFDPNAFVLQPAGFLGNAGRNILYGPGFANLDFSLAKDTAIKPLGESGKLEFRAEVFNILNRANFASPNNTVFAGRVDGESPLATAGTITSTAASSRQVQFALKLLF